MSGIDELFDLIAAAAPETRDKLRLESVRYSKKENRAYFSLESQTLITEKSFLKVKEILRREFPQMKCSLRITSPDLKDAFLKDPDRYALPINQYLLRQFPSVRSWEFDMRWISEGGRLYLEVPDAFALRYLKEQGAEEKLREAVKGVFKLDENVTLRVSGDAEKRLKEITAERERQEVLLKKRMAENEAKGVTLTPVKKKTDDRIKGRKIGEEPRPIGELDAENGTAVVHGVVLTCERRDVSGGETALFTFDLTDYTGTLCCKVFTRYREKVYGEETEPVSKVPLTEAERQAVDEFYKHFQPGKALLIRGEIKYDDFARDRVMMVRDVTADTWPERMDNAPEKRIELHMHTNMSNMDGITAPEKLIARAAKWGHSAVAVTDHGVLQAFPEAFGAAKKNGIKLIPGMEGYMTFDDDIVLNPGGRSLKDPMVVLDLETTGLNVRKARIIEIGAVRIRDGVVEDRLNLFVDPEMDVPQKVTDITHISTQMLRGSPTAKEALPRLMEFIGDCPIAAHNASFDCGILSFELKRLGREWNGARIDTLSMARRIYPDLKSYRLGSLCKHLHVSLKGAHRAVNDAEATAKCLSLMLEEAAKKGCETLDDLNRMSDAPTLGTSYHVVLLARDREGLENLNRLVSESHLKYFHRKPLIPRSVLQKHRGGLLVGSACAAGELYDAILRGAGDDQLKKIARFYDYLEIQPLGNNAFLLRDGQAENEDELRDNNRKIVALGKELGLPVCATGDVHFIDPEDAVFRAIIQAGQGFDDAEHQPPLYLKTTEEMLEEFSYLGEETCRKVVLDDPKLIASRIGDITLYPIHPEGKTTFSPYWEEAEGDITNMTWSRARELYGDDLPELVKKRIDKELGAIIGYGYATLYSIANKLVQKSLRDHYVVGSRGSVGSSVVAFMCGITEVNPLPPHYQCPTCHKGYFDIPKEFTIGVDLPDKNCPVCGNPLRKDGYDIPFEVFLGFKGDKVPDIDLNFSGEYQPTAHQYVKELFGSDNVFRAGTIGTLAEKTAYGFVLKYLEERNLTVTEAEKRRLANGCVGVKRTTGQHPAGMVVVPKGYEIYQFTGIQHPADDMESDIVTTHFDFNSMHDILVKLDILGHDDPTMLHLLEELTGVPYLDIPLDDKKVMSLFQSPEALGITSEELGCSTGTYGVPEFGTGFVRQLLDDTRPSTMQELVRISGLSHGTNVWLGNTKDIIDQGIATLSDCFCTRDDIMNQLMKMGVEAKMSFDIMESVRKGKGLKPAMEEAMHAHNVPEWMMESCRKIKYMFPKGHAVAYVTMALRVAWYKVYRPLAYYAAYFTIRGDGFDACTMIFQDVKSARNKLRECEELVEGNKDATAKEQNQVVAMQMVLEMMLRGFRFLPVDLYHSHVSRFQPVDDTHLLVPFISMGGLGESAAKSIVEARETPFLSLEDLTRRAKVSSAVTELLQQQGCLKDLPESSQTSLLEGL